MAYNETNKIAEIEISELGILIFTDGFTFLPVGLRGGKNERQN